MNQLPIIDIPRMTLHSLSAAVQNVQVRRGRDYFVLFRRTGRRKLGGRGSPSREDIDGSVHDDDAWMIVIFYFVSGDFLLIFVGMKEPKTLF